jgi:hypothetical protein
VVHVSSCDVTFTNKTKTFSSICTQAAAILACCIRASLQFRSKILWLLSTKWRVQCPTSCPEAVPFSIQILNGYCLLVNSALRDSGRSDSSEAGEILRPVLIRDRQAFLSLSARPNSTCSTHQSATRRGPVLTSSHRTKGRRRAALLGLQGGASCSGPRHVPSRPGPVRWTGPGGGPRAMRCRRVMVRSRRRPPAAAPTPRELGAGGLQAVCPSVQQASVVVHAAPVSIHPSRSVRVDPSESDPSERV